MAINYDEQEGFGLAPIKQESQVAGPVLNVLAPDWSEWMEIPVFSNAPNAREVIHAQVDAWLDAWVKTGGHPGA